MPTSKQALLKQLDVSAGKLGDIRQMVEDGREVIGSHALLAVGSVPQTRGIGL